MSRAATQLASMEGPGRYRGLSASLQMRGHHADLGVVQIIALLMGVTGSGKTTVGSLLAQGSGPPFRRHSSLGVPCPCPSVFGGGQGGDFHLDDDRTARPSQKARKAGLPAHGEIRVSRPLRNAVQVPWWLKPLLIPVPLPQRWKCVRENFGRPSGTCSLIPLFPALKRWAIIETPLRGLFRTLYSTEQLTN
jgi:hypothetical protein